jgi:N-methylhydantoinase B
MGTWGAARDTDGQEGVSHIGANQSNVPIEMIEATYPIRIESYGFVADSGGHGKQRGGLSIKREYRVLSDTALLNVRSAKRDFPPHGLSGGSSGAPSMNRIVSGNSSRVIPVLLSEPIPLKQNDVFSHVMASGGGYGDAFERDGDAVLGDVVLGKVTIEGAKRDYGVVIKETHGGLSLDQDATTKTRDEMREVAPA